MSGSWIDSASAHRTGPIGYDAIHRDAILALPVVERDAAVLELEQARRCVLRVAGDHAGEALAMLGLAPQDAA